MDQSMRNLPLIFRCKIEKKFNEKERIRIDFSDGEEDEDDEGISERSLRRTPSDDGKNNLCKSLMTKMRLFSKYVYSIGRF